jgi:hypothetical protein
LKENYTKIPRTTLRYAIEKFDEKKRKEILENCQTEDERIRTEKIIKPLLRGKDIQKDTYDWKNLYLINTHNGYVDEFGNKLGPIDIDLYPSVKIHLDVYYEKLSRRYDKGVTLYNLRDCSYLHEFDKPKIIYSEIVINPQFTLDNKGFVPEATVFFIIGSNLIELVHFLNSNHCAWIFKKFYAGGGLGDKGFRYKKEFLEKLPLPKKIESLTDYNYYSKENYFNSKEKEYLKKVSDELFNINSD